MKCYEVCTQLLLCYCIHNYIQVFEAVCMQVVKK